MKIPSQVKVARSTVDWLRQELATFTPKELELPNACGVWSVAEELASSQRLQEFSTRLVQVADFKQLLNEVLEAAIDIGHADMGNVQLLDGDALKIAAQRGFEAPFLAFFDDLKDDCSACAVASRRRSW